MEITFVIPTYNEAENLPKLVSALFRLPLPDLKVLVVDDNSPDGTGAIADRLANEHPKRFSVLHRAGKEGLGPAYKAGIQQALDDGAEAIGQMDADFSHPPEKIPEMVAMLDKGYDVVIGSRYTRGGGVDDAWPLWRKKLSAFGNWYARSILGLKARDVTGGFRIYRRKTIECMQLVRMKSTGYIYMVEMAYVANRLGCSFVEVPICFAERTMGKSKMSLRIQLEAAIRCWQLKGLHKDLEPQKG